MKKTIVTWGVFGIILLLVQSGFLGYIKLFCWNKSRETQIKIDNIISTSVYALLMLSLLLIFTWGNCLSENNQNLWASYYGWGLVYLTGAMILGNILNFIIPDKLEVE